MDVAGKSEVFIMAGGSGTRLAPLSLTLPGSLPKQFLSLIGDRSLLQEALQRLTEDLDITVIPEKKYEDEVLRQAEKISRSISCLSEPFGCNTAAAIMLACLYSLEKHGDEEKVLFLMPADHMMDNLEFRQIFQRSVELAYDAGKIVTIGIPPTRPETGYGYIRTNAEKTSVIQEKEIDSSGKDRPAYFRKVSEFVEKPDIETAKRYLESGEYFWNAGIFAFKLKTMLSALKKHMPDLYMMMEKIDGDFSPENIKKNYLKIKEKGLNISIDYAVMEKESQNILLVPASKDLEWNDLGGWLSLENYLDVDREGNRNHNRAFFKGSKNNTVFNYTDKNIVIENLKDILVVSADKGTLICRKASSSRAKEIIPGLEAGKDTEPIDCERISVSNHSGSYIGLIDVQDIKVESDEHGLRVTLREQ